MSPDECRMEALARFDAMTSMVELHARRVDGPMLVFLADCCMALSVAARDLALAAAGADQNGGEGDESTRKGDG